MRIGAKKRPFYRIVAIDERKQRNGAYLDLIGTYNPLTEPKDIKIDQTKLDAWIKKGAVLSDGFLRITGKAPQRPPRKPKKAPKKAAAKPQVVEETSTKEAKVDADSQLSEAGEATTESTSSDVHEAGQAGSEQGEEAELESPVQPNDEAPPEVAEQTEEVTEPTPEAESEVKK